MGKDVLFLSSKVINDWYIVKSLPFPWVMEKPGAITLVLGAVSVGTGLAFWLV